MKIPVMLSLRGQQTYPDQEPEIIDLITEGTLEQLPKGWQISYQESDLTGLAGVTTTFVLQGDSVTLIRNGALNSRMIFRKGVAHDSLYHMEFGALMIRVCATQLQWQLSYEGGVVDMNYTIEIEQTATGAVSYHLEITPKQ